MNFENDLVDSRGQDSKSFQGVHAIDPALSRRCFIVPTLFDHPVRKQGYKSCHNRHSSGRSVLSYSSCWKMNMNIDTFHWIRRQVIGNSKLELSNFQVRTSLCNLLQVTLQLLIWLLSKTKPKWLILSLQLPVDRLRPGRHHQAFLLLLQPELPRQQLSKRVPEQHLFFPNGHLNDFRTMDAKMTNMIFFITYTRIAHYIQYLFDCALVHADWKLQSGVWIGFIICNPNCNCSTERP